MEAMGVLHAVLLVLHILGLAAVGYGVLVQLPRESRRMTPAVVHGATTQFVTGLALVGVLEAGDEAVDHVKVAVKLLVALVIVGLAHGLRRRDSVGVAVLGSMLALEVVNVVVALVW